MASGKVTGGVLAAVLVAVPVGAVAQDKSLYLNCQTVEFYENDTTRFGRFERNFTIRVTDDSIDKWWPRERVWRHLLRCPPDDLGMIEGGFDISCQLERSPRSIVQHMRSSRPPEAGTNRYAFTLDRMNSTYRYEDVSDTFRWWDESGDCIVVDNPEGYAESDSEQFIEGRAF